ncbi:FGGY-family carbohydrate kinase [Leifsonia naganoensis]|uniref:Xylulokinase n=1 Tax=Leifsonia naganoensis TaxID=150025 RepID=A0A853DJ72_9MICO|nr:FGGY family carbohydrate kinase [Leifsonia naganoensis]NYK09126.1 xylulokinase [Leifsonia naganoensis]
MTFIGIDIGTTRIKALLYDPASPERRLTERRTPVTSSAIGDLRDADAVLDAVVACLDELLESATVEERAALAGIGVTALSEEVVLLDEDGSSIGAMPTWYNREAGTAAARERGIDSSFSWAKLRWAFDDLADGGSARFPGTRSDDVTGVTTLSGYIADRLAAAGRFVIDHSHASRTGFFDVRTATWEPDAFTGTGWPASALPELVPTGAIVGTLDATFSQRWGVPATGAVALAGHDHFCGAFAVGVRGEGEVYLSAGTSEAHCLIVDDAPTGPLPDGVGLGRYVDGQRFYLHRQLPSGHLYQQWRGLLGLAGLTQMEEAELLAAQPIGSRGATVVPGTGTDARSSFLAVDPDAGAATLLRALLEGLACAALETDRDLERISQRPITAIVASGVPCRSPFWQELRGQLSAAPLTVSDEEEAPALGAALIVQRSTTGRDVERPPTIPVVPDPQRSDAYRAVFARYEAARATR